jgi:hypothetical protein
MTIARVSLALSCLALCSAPVVAADLTEIDRTITKEPAYQSKAPKYCLLVLGPGAKTRVWLVLDGDTLYIDRNGNGDLSDKGERIKGRVAENESKKVADFLAGEILDVNGKTKHTNISVRILALKNGKAEQTFISGTVAGKHTFSVAMDMLQDQRFADRPQDAPIIHFGGPLRMGLSFLEQQELVRGEELFAIVGTPGLGKGTFAGLIHKTVPADVHPVADIEFPNRKPGGPSVRLKVILKDRC